MTVFQVSIDPAAKQCELLRPLRRSRVGGNLVSFVAYQRTPLGPRLRGDDVIKLTVFNCRIKRISRNNNGNIRGHLQAPLLEDARGF
jgi:hypothetical protein